MLVDYDYMTVEQIMQIIIDREKIIEYYKNKDIELDENKSKMVYNK